MPTFSNSPPDDPRGFALHLVRCPTGRALVGIVTSPDLIGCATHFWGGRTIPHEEEACEPCKDGSPWRWHSWLSFYSPLKHDHLLFESTARVTKIFTRYRKSHGTLRGCKFRAQRRTAARNSRVFLEVAPANLQDIQLPDPPDLRRCLCTIWNIPYTAVQIDGILRDVPRVVTHSHGNGEDLAPVKHILDPTNDSR